MRLKEANHAGEAGIYGSLTVIGDVKAKNVRRIERNVDMIQQESVRQQAQVQDYWSKLSDDGRITPLEKKIIKKEWESIGQSYTALLTQATAQGLTGTDYWEDYAGAFEDLRTYLFTTIELFDDMEATTELADRDTFNGYFSSYYYAEKFLQMAMTAGIVDKIDLQILSSLDDPGTEGDIKVYRGSFYQYKDGVWVKLGSEGYLGILNSYSEIDNPPSEGQYFLAGSNMLFIEAFYVNGEQFYVNDDIFGVKAQQALKGEVWYYHNGTWAKAQEDDWRYISCMQDYMILMGTLPVNVKEIFQTEIKQTGELYLGISSSIPQNVTDGQYFVYSGTTVTNWTYSKIYKYVEGTGWEELDATLPQNQDYYMRCLKDILSLNDVDDGYFAVIFAQAFFANTAALNSLAVRTITLASNGNIQSEETVYAYHTSGLKIDADGNIDANGVTHIGGSCTIDGDLDVGSQAGVLGNLTVQSINVNNNAKIKNTGEANVLSLKVGSGTVFSKIEYSGGRLSFFT